VPTIVFCCGAVLLLVALIYLPIFLVRKGFDVFVGCIGNGFVLLIAAICLVIYIVVADVKVCQIWLVGDALCTLWARIGIQIS
jgi:hypothetical protein